MRSLRAGVGLVVALALQTTLAHGLLGNRAAFDLVVIAVVYVALLWGPSAGLLAGAAAGLVQDALAGGIVGVGGLAKTLVGFLAGIAGTQFIMTGALPRLVVFFVGSMLHALVVVGFYEVIEPRSQRASYPAIATQALLNAVIGVLVMHLVERAPDWWHQRRLRRASLRGAWRT